MGGTTPARWEDPLLADRNTRVTWDYGCVIEDKGFALRASNLIDPKGVLRQITTNDLPVGRSVDEALRRTGVPVHRESSTRLV